ncbi:MAG: hypothetical protein WD029_11450 [Microthrixaceae bacterium]
MQLKASQPSGLAELHKFAARRHGVVSTSEVASFAVTRAQIRSGVRRGDWLAPHSGVLVAAAAPATWMQRCMIATHRTHGIISHRAAARLHGLDGFDTDIVELTVPDSKHRHNGGFLLHRTSFLSGEDCTVKAGISVTSLARTLVDLGAVVSDDKVEQALDDSIRRGCSIRWVTETLERVDRPGPSGCASLRRVLARPDRQGPIPDSIFERLMERTATACGLPQPERQFCVYESFGPQNSKSGKLVARLDAAWPEARLGVEAHSARWHDGSRRGRADQRRDNRLAGLGWELLYLGWWDLSQPSRFQSDLAAAYAMRCPS